MGMNDKQLSIILEMLANELDERITDLHEALIDTTFERHTTLKYIGKDVLSIFVNALEHRKNHPDDWREDPTGEFFILEDLCAMRDRLQSQVAMLRSEDE